MNLDLLIDDIYFLSTNYVRYVDMFPAFPEDYGNRLVYRAIIIQSTTTGKDKSYLVSIYNMDGNPPTWEKNIEMEPKPMKVNYVSNDSIGLIGFGLDSNGESAADYGLTISHDGNRIIKMTLNNLGNDMDIVYLKTEMNPVVPIGYNQKEAEACTLPDLRDSFKSDLLNYIKCLERKKEKNVLAEEVVDVCSYFAVKLINTYHQNTNLSIQLESSLNEAEIPVSIGVVVQIKEQVYSLASELIPEMKSREAKRFFWNKTNHLLAVNNLNEIQTYLESLKDDCK